jgi:hypothetical protein
MLYQTPDSNIKHAWLAQAKLLVNGDQSWPQLHHFEAQTNHQKTPQLKHPS